MVNARSAPVMYKVQVDETVLNKHMDQMKAANTQTGQEQNIPSPSEQTERLSESMGSPPSSSIKETLESKMGTSCVAASVPLAPDEEDEFFLRYSVCSRQAMVQYTPPISKAESEELDL
eukprot:g25810.t1